MALPTSGALSLNAIHVEAGGFGRNVLLMTLILED